MNKKKFQITLPHDLIDKIEAETQFAYTSKSLWFEKILRSYFEETEKRQSIKLNKRIELNI